MKHYVSMIFMMIVTAVTMIFIASRSATDVTNALNDHYMELFREGATGVSSPWYDEGYHIVDGRFIAEMSRMKRDEAKVLSIGSSVCVLPFHDELVEQHGGIPYRFLTCGNGCYRSDRILYTLAKTENLIGKDDIVKLEVSFSTFREPAITISETMLDKWGKYSVGFEDPDDRDAGISVQKNTVLKEPVYYLNTRLIKIQSLWELSMDAKDQLLHGSHGIGLTARAAEFGYEKNGSYDGVIIPGNFRNNYYNAEAVAENLSITEHMEEELLKLIEEIDRDTNLVVELSPMPPKLDETAFGKDYEAYIDQVLIPYLNEEGIRFVDYRNDYTQNEYADGVHLDYEAGLRYTKQIMEDINEYKRQTAGSLQGSLR